MRKTKIATMLGLSVLLVTGCSNADIVSHNLSKEADTFGIQRRFVAIDTRTDAALIEIIGNLSVQNDAANKDVDVIVKLGDGTYRKHFVHLSRDVSYFVEDLGNTDVAAYHYQVRFLPESLVPTMEVDTSLNAWVRDMVD